MRLTGDIRIRVLSESENRRIRLVAVASSVLLHLVIGAILFFLPTESSILNVAPAEELGGMGGGGGGGKSKEYIVEFGPSPGPLEPQTNVDEHFARFSIIQLEITRPDESGTPVIEKAKPQPRTKHKQSGSMAMTMPNRRVRGSGPGSGGGFGGGIGGGIGKGKGYSIDWGGVGSRRLLSGRIPRYPSGTDKQMAVSLQFSVLPDGSVANIVPLQKSDELLEREAIAALQTWRFDPLPSQFDQKSQVGKITFNFKLE